MDFARNQRHLETLRQVVVTVSAIFVAGAMSVFGEARISGPIYPPTVEVVKERPASIDLSWKAHVQAEGGTFRLFSGQNKTDMRLLGEIEAQVGQHSYRFQNGWPSNLMSFGDLHHYELRFLADNGTEVILGSLLVIEENLEPATASEIFSQQGLATLVSSTTLKGNQGRVANIHSRNLFDRGNQCPPTPPP